MTRRRDPRVLLMSLAALTLACQNQPAEGDDGFRPVTTSTNVERPWWEANPASTTTTTTLTPPPGEAKSWTEIRLPADVLFDTDSDFVDDAGRRLLAERVAEHRLTDAQAVVVSGHTDSTGTYAHNLDLSQRRADAAATVLVSLGVDRSVITTEAWADTQRIPTLPGTTADAANSLQRRIEIRALVPDQGTNR